MEIIILGSGCQSCNNLYEKIKEKAPNADVKKSDDIMDLMKYSVMSTPAVVIDGKVVHAGGTPSDEAIESWLQ